MRSPGRAGGKHSASKSRKQSCRDRVGPTKISAFIIEWAYAHWVRQGALLSPGWRGMSAPAAIAEISFKLSLQDGHVRPKLDFSPLSHTWKAL